MAITPFAKQEELIKHVLNDTTTVIFYGGGIRGGKSFSSILADLLYLKKYPGSKVAIVRESLPTLKRNTLPVFKKIVPANRIHKFNHTSQTVEFTYRSESGFYSELEFFPENYDADKELERWKGLEKNLIHLEEGSELQEASFDKAIERAGTWLIPGVDKQPPPKIIVTMNPTRGWLKKRVYDRWKNGTLPKGWVYIPALITDNPHLPGAYLENLKNLPKKLYNVFVKGIWEDLTPEDIFAYEFSAQKHVKECKYNPELPLILSFDFNKKNTCLLIQMQRRGVRVPLITVFKEYHLLGGIDSVCQTIIKDYPKARFLFSGDATGKSGSGLTEGNVGYWQKIMANFGHRIWNPRIFLVPKTNPGHKSSWLLSNVLFKHYEILIDPSCEGLINDLEHVMIITKGKKMEIDKSDELLTHFLDCLRYFFNVFCPEGYKLVPDSLRQDAEDDSLKDAA